MLKYNTAADIHEASICDDDYRCPVCYYDGDGEHKGQDVTKLNEQIADRPVWTVPIYADAAEMLHAVTMGPDRHVLSDPEIMLQVLQYAADCEAR